MRRFVLALAALAAAAFVVVPIAAAKHAHHLSHGQKVRAWEHKFHFKLTHANRNRDADHDGVSDDGCVRRTERPKPIDTED